MTETIKIPLFPLGLVLLPGMELPLHIFEARYRLMISECVADMTPFGIVQFDGQAIHSVGCMARITEVIEAYDDGRMDIMTRGEGRFVVRELIQEKAYMEARVIFFDDNMEAEDHDTTEVVQRAMDLIEAASDGDAGLSASAVTADMNPKQLSFAIAAMEGFSPAERQGLLEMVSPAEIPADRISLKH